MPVTALSGFPTATTGLAIVPPIARTIGPDASVQRLRFHTGRSLTAAALRLESANGEARMGLTLRALADGIVDGLQVAMADQATDPGGFTIGAGFAVTPSGQDIAVNRIVRFRIGDLPRYDGTVPGGDVSASPQGIGVLVAEAVAAEETRFVADADRRAAFLRDQQLDPAAAPYQDPRILDGLRVSFHIFTDQDPFLALPDGVSRAVAALIEAERTGAPIARFLRFAVALALVAVDDTGAILWMHRHGAARRGGGIDAPLPVAAVAGGMAPRLRQSSVNAFLETVAAQIRADPGRVFDPSLYPVLPPAGIVPAPGAVRPALFPPGYRETVAPIPLRQLDAVLAAAEALAPYDRTRPRDEVRWYVPVPDHLYDPELLVLPTVDQRFYDAITQIQTRLADALATRAALRAQAPVTEGLRDSDRIPIFRADVDPVPGEDAFPPSAVPDVPDLAGEAQAAFDAWADTLDPGLLTAAQAAMADFSDPAATARRGVVPFLESLSAGIRGADDFVDFGFTRVQTDIYRLRQTLLDNEEATKLATFPVLAGIAKGSNALATSIGLAEHFLGTRTQAAAAAAAAAPAAAAPASAAPAAQPAFSSVTLLRSMASDDVKIVRGVSSALSTGTSAAAVAALTSGSAAKPSSAAPAISISPATVSAATVSADIADLSLGIRAVALDGVSSRTTEALVAAEVSAAVTKNAYLDVFNSQRQTAVDEIAFISANETRAGIAFASAIPGEFQDVRTVTIAARLADPAAVAARTSALRIKADALVAADGLGIGMEGVKAPIVSLQAANAVLSRGDFDALMQPLEASANTSAIAAALRRVASVIGSGRTTEEDVLLIAFGPLGTALPAGSEVVLDELRRRHAPVAADGLPAAVLARALDPDPIAPAAESDYLASAVAILESVVSVYRVTEKRIAVLRGVADAAQVLAAALAQIAERWREALAGADRDVAEARHDLRSAEALVSEEEVRVAALDAERRRILAENVKVMAYARIRRLSPHGYGTTSGRLLPGVYDDPLPAVLAAPARLPADLARLTAVLRDVPILWFADRERLAEGFKDPAVLDATFHWSANAAAIRFNAQTTIAASQAVKVAAVTGFAATAAATAATGAVGMRAMAQATAGTIAEHYVQISKRLLFERAGLDLSRIDLQGWQEKKTRADAELSLNDLIEGGRDTESAKRALNELETIERVAGALHQRLRGAPAAARLLWAEALSVYDGDPVMTDITRLPGWFSLGQQMRDEIRRLHAWLFGRMNRAVPEAVAMMSDIVQVAVLLAANAETASIVRARIDAQKTVGAGDTVDLVLDRGTPPIGSTVWFGAPGAERFRGTVSNLYRGTLRVAVDPQLAGRVTLRADTPVFVDTVRAVPFRHGR